MKKMNFLLTLLFLCIITVAFSSCNSECDHQWDGGELVRVATCTEDGAAKYTCKLCSETKELPITANGHSYYNSLVMPASCTDDGYVEKTCENCYDKYTEVLEKTGHSLEETTTVESTCTAEGSVSGVCTLCSETVVEPLPKLEHMFNRVSDEGTVKATCNKDGVTVYVCSKCSAATKTVEVKATGKHVWSTDPDDYYVKVKPTPTSDGQKIVHCKTCTDEKTAVYTYSEYQNDLNTAISKLSGVDVSAFGTSPVTKMSTTKYAEPTSYPISSHPRLLINSSVLDDIKEAILLDENVGWINRIASNASLYSSGLLGEVQTYSSSGSYGPRGTHNLNEEIYECIMAKAFLYLLTDVETYAYDAIRMTKEYMSTMQIKSVNDACRYWGYAMFTAAIVYDWCYSAMTEQDMLDIRRGVEFCVLKTKGSTGGYKNNMEVGFPPSGQGAVCGHGSERQLLRDYLSFALAIYDEEPTWYEFIGGRFFEEYVPVRNEFYKSMMYPQGISVYVQIRYTSDLWSAWLMQSATGTNPYSSNMAEVIPSLFCRVVDGGYNIFAEGDDEGKSGENILYGLSFAASISAYLFNDTRAASWAKYLDYKYSGSVYMLILRSSGVKESNNRYADLDLIRYNPGFLGEVVAHSDWTNNAASVLMKIGGSVTANHDHADAGSFQIYYKGILAGDTGFYDSYGSTHHYNYHQATIAHNSIIIYRNGEYIGQTPRRAEPPNLQSWATNTYKTATVTGFSSAYKDAEQTVPIYAYVAGDIAPAYSGNFDKAERRMLAVFDTENPDIPLYFFVYDSMSAKYATDNVTFLLHTPTKPVISGNVITTSASGANLVVQNLMGGDKIKAIGGQDQNYVVNGDQLETRNGEHDGFWGRVEISSESSGETDTLLNVMYVTSYKNTTITTATKFENDTVVGSVIGNSAAVFVDSSDRRATEFSFTAKATGNDMNYYVSGVKAGNWRVTVGSTTLTVTATEEGGMLYFKAPAGQVTLTPVN